MNGRAKAPHKIIRAFTGKIFVAQEWRKIPDGCEDEAARLVRDGYLEVEEDYPHEEEQSKQIAAAAVDATASAATLADKWGISLSDISGSGASGRILVRDVQAFIDWMTSPEEDEE